MNVEWLRLISTTLEHGEERAPRGKLTRDLRQHTIVIDARFCVLAIPARKLNYHFMAAEAYWILSGDDRVATIAPWNIKIAEFSDDGERFFGAYGPKVKAQLPYVIEKLLEDRDTRQAGLTLWRESPPKTKDIPCTISIFFSLVDNQLSCHVYMRSSDQWLGLPYDLFNFSMLTHLVCCRYNERHGGDTISPGWLFLTAASSHLYEPQWGLAQACLDENRVELTYSTPELMYVDENYLMATLKRLRDDKTNRWWV